MQKKSRKSKGKDAALGPQWLNLAAMADAFGVTLQGFAKTIRPLVPDKAVKGAGQRNAVRIHCRSTIDAFAQAAVEKAIGQNPDAPMLEGGGSPQLERWRAARADREEMTRDRERRQLIPLAELEPMLTRFAMILRRAAEEIQRTYGNDASKILNSAVDEAEEAWAEMSAGASDERAIHAEEKKGKAGSH